MAKQLRRVRSDCKFKLMFEVRRLEKEGWKRGVIQRSADMYVGWECYMYKQLEEYEGKNIMGFNEFVNSVGWK